MEIVGLGAALGMLVAAVCVMCYRKGVRDGMRKGESPSQSCGLTAPFRQGGLSGSRDDEAAMMMRRYEAILSYDPYGPSTSGREGERV